MIGLGVLLAIVGPLLLIPIIWLVYRLLWWVLRRFVPRRLSGVERPAAAAVAVFVVGAVLVGSYLPGLREYERLCDEHARPSLGDRVEVEGFFRTKMAPYDATSYLREGGFRFVEAPEWSRSGENVRYTIDPSGTVRQEPALQIESSYGVRKTFSERPSSISMSEKIVYEIATGHQIARAASLTYHGGPLSLFLGSYGMRHCPDILTERGSKDFSTFYNLEAIVLGGEPLP